MPSGRTHDRITLWILPLVVGPTAWFTRSALLTVIIAVAYLIGGFMLGPDLDIRSVQYNRWGPIRWIWLPYQIALPHRSTFSHGPLIGTILRVIYLAVWIALFTVVITLGMNAIWNAQLTGRTLIKTFHTLFHDFLTEWIAILIGLELGAMSHYTSDIVGSFLVKSVFGRSSKRKKKSRKKSKRRRS